MSTYNEDRMQLVEDFINTYDLYLDEPEHLRQPADLEHFLSTHGITINAPLSDAQLDSARDLRGHLRACWSAETLEALAGGLNALLAHTQVELQVAPDEDQLAFQFVMPANTPIIDRLMVECATGLMAIVRTHGMERMRSCMAEPCRDVYIDTSRNKSRRFCSQRCANRYNVAAFRDRQKSDDE